jgi:hypothetical protein
MWRGRRFPGLRSRERLKGAAMNNLAVAAPLADLTTALAIEPKHHQVADDVPVGAWRGQIHPLKVEDDHSAGMVCSDMDWTRLGPGGSQFSWPIRVTRRQTGPHFRSSPQSAEDSGCEPES